MFLIFSRVQLFNLVLLKHLMGWKWIWNFSALEELQPSDFLLLGCLVPPHVVDTEAESGCLVVRTVDEALALVVTRDFVFEFVRQLVETQVVETDLRVVEVLPQPFEYWFEFVGLRVAVGAFELFEVKFALHFEPRFDFVVMGFQFSFKSSLTGFFFFFFLGFGFFFLCIFITSLFASFVTAFFIIIFFLTSFLRFCFLFFRKSRFYLGCTKFKWT